MKFNNAIFTILLTLCFLLAPMFKYAGANNLVVSCCNTNLKSDKKDCCQNDKDSKETSGCNGKCKSAGCSTSVASINIILLNTADYSVVNFFRTSKKVTFAFNETHISSGFHSIWTPPNIG